MKIRVQYTAQLRTALGRSAEEIELPDGGTVASLIGHLAHHYNGQSAAHFLAPTGEIAPGLLVVVNDGVVSAASAKSAALRSGDVVSLLPPIAGG